MNSQALPTPCHCLALDLWQTEPGGRLNLGIQRRCGGLVYGLGGEVAGSVGISSISVMEAAHIFNESTVALIPPVWCLTPWYILASTLGPWTPHNRLSLIWEDHGGGGRDVALSHI